jgi:hypothetical protein
LKTKFLLTLLTLNGLFWGVNSVCASDTLPLGSNRTLSYNIAQLIQLDAPSLVEVAIDRAMLAQQANTARMPTPTTAGVPKLDTSQPDRPPAVRGRVTLPVWILGNMADSDRLQQIAHLQTIGISRS